MTLLDEPTGPALKRKREDFDSEEKASPEVGAITRCKEYWMDDGSIIIQAGSTQYRVH